MDVEEPIEGIEPEAELVVLIRRALMADGSDSGTATAAGVLR